MNHSLKALVVLLILVVSISITAQEETPEATCDYAPMIETLALAQSLLEESDDPAQVLRSLKVDISLFEASCSALSFSSEIEGLQPVIGPVEIPEGVYRAIATTEAAMIVQVDAIEGECEGRGFGSLFNLSGGQGVDGAESLFISEGCTAFISISNTREPWTLVFEKA